MTTETLSDERKTQRLTPQTFDVGVLGCVSFLYVDQSLKLVELPDDVAAELSRIEQISLHDQRLSLQDARINYRLQRLLSDVLSVDVAGLHQVGGYLKVPTRSNDPVLISVFPYVQTLLKHAEAPLRLAEIRISYPKRPNLAAFSRAMRELYELSASESKVVSLLVQGRNTKEIASSLEVADSTLRTHLKRIFSKTHTRHQAELVSKILLCDTYVIPDAFAWDNC